MTAKQFATWFTIVVTLSIGAALGMQTFGGVASAATSVFAVFQGGTGTSSPSGILYGSGSATALQTVGIGAGLSFAGGSLSSTASPSPATSTNPLMATYFVATSTSVASRLPYASTTAISWTATSTGTFGINLSGGCFAVGGVCLTSSSGTVTNIATTYPITGGPITTTGTLSLAFGTTTANTWSLLQTFTSGFVSQASSTVSALMSMNNASSTLGSFVTSLWIPNSSSQAPTQAGQLALDTTNDQLVIGDGSLTSVFDKRRNLLLSYGTSTAWAGTTTLPVFVIPMGMTWNTISCIVQPAGATLNAQYQYANPTAYTTVNSTMVVGSSTPGIITFTTNNTPTAQATSTISFGTPASSPTSIGCTFTGTVTGT